MTNIINLWEKVSAQLIYDNENYAMGIGKLKDDDILVIVDKRTMAAIHYNITEDFDAGGEPSTNTCIIQKTSAIEPNGPNDKPLSPRRRRR